MKCKYFLTALNTCLAESVCLRKYSFDYALMTDREEAKESKRMKREQDKAEKAEQAKQNPKRKSKKKGRDGGAAPGESSDPGGDPDQKKRRRASSTRTRGNFSDTDPPVLAKGSGFSAECRMESFDTMKAFVETVAQGKPALLRLKKAQVRKVLSETYAKDLEEEESAKTSEWKEFVNNQTKSFLMTQANLSAAAKKLDGSQRKNQSVALEGPCSAGLGFDLLLAGETSKVKEAEAHKFKLFPVVLDRAALLEHLHGHFGCNFHEGNGGNRKEFQNLNHESYLISRSKSV